MKVFWQILNNRAVIPEYATDGSNAVDLKYIGLESIKLYPTETVLIKTGLAMAMPDGYAGLIMPRSGLGSKYGIILSNVVGFIDSDYRGEIMVSLLNRGQNPIPFEIHPFDRIAQMTFIMAPQVEHENIALLPETARGTKGFGSTG